MVVTAVALLLVASVSLVSEVTEAYAVKVPRAGARLSTHTTSEKTALSPLPRLAIEAETLPTSPTAGVKVVQPSGAVKDWNDVKSGRDAVNAAFVAASGPLLVTVVVKVTVPPGWTVPGSAVAEIAR